MKKLYILLFLISSLLVSCSSYQQDLDRMGAAVKSHIKYRDQENGILTKIEYLKALSYEKLPENERQKEDEVYLCKIYIKGTWAYDGSYRVYNMNDTIDAYFSSKKTFLRMDEPKNQ